MERYYFWQKMVLFIAVVLASAVVGNLLILATGKIIGLDITDVDALFNAISDDSTKNAMKVGLAINHLFTFALSALLFSKLVNGSNWLRYFNLKGSLSSYLVFLFIALMVCAYPLIGVIGYWVSLIEFPDWMQQIDNQSIEQLTSVLKMNGPIDLLTNLLVVAVLPAIGEELLFRGVLQREFIKKLGNPHVAIWVTSFIFGAVHLQVVGLFPKMILGLIMGYAYYWTGSLWYSILLHFFNNGMQTVLLYLSPDRLVETIESSDSEISFGASIFAILFSLFLCSLIIQQIIAWRKAHSNQNHAGSH